MFICARCAGVHPTCCRMDPSQTEQCFPLSEAERLRLAPYAHADGRPDHALAATTPSFATALKSLFPGRAVQIDALFPRPGKHMVLPILSDGSCVFLGPHGCDLPREARPWYCRLFPLWVHKGKLDRFIPRECLITNEASGIGGVLAILGLDEAGALALHNSLRSDWGLS